MKDFFIIIVSMSILLLLSQCTFDNAKEYYTEMRNDSLVDCADTVDVSFSIDVFPIIVDNCISCHNDITTYGGRNYDTYEGIMEVVNNGKLVKVINHTSGYVQMPKNADKLPQCNIELIEAWIAQGSKNN